MPLRHWLLLALLALLPALALPLGAFSAPADGKPAAARLLVLYPPALSAEAALAGLAAAGARPIAAGRGGAWLVAADAAADAALTPALYRHGAWLVLDAQGWLAGCLLPG